MSDDKKSIWIECYFIDSVTDFILMAKQLVAKYKRDGFHKFLHRVSQSDRAKLSSDKWKIISTNEDNILASCDISDTVECVFEGFLCEE